MGANLFCESDTKKRGTSLEPSSDLKWTASVSRLRLHPKLQPLLGLILPHGLRRFIGRF